MPVLCKIILRDIYKNIDHSQDHYRPFCYFYLDVQLQSVNSRLWTTKHRRHSLDTARCGHL